MVKFLPKSHQQNANIDCSFHLTYYSVICLSKRPKKFDFVTQLNGFEKIVWMGKLETLLFSPKIDKMESQL